MRHLGTLTVILLAFGVRRYNLPDIIISKNATVNDDGGGDDDNDGADDCDADDDNEDDDDDDDCAC